MPEQLVPLPNTLQHSPAVIAILGLNPGSFTLQGTNIYIVGTGSSRILVDSGQGIPAFEQLLLDTLATAGVSAISHVLCTHRHHDHIGGIHQLLRVVAALGQDPQTVAVHKYITEGDRHGLNAEAEAKTDPQLKANAWSSTSHQPVVFADFLPIVDGQQFSTEGATLTAIYTPGHTDDHVAYLFREENAIFTGDCVLGQGSAIFENLSHLMASLRRLVDLEPQRLYCGHGPVVQDGVAKIREYMAHRDAREAQIVRVMRSREALECGLADLAAEIYPDVDASVLPAAQ
eukprot:jgi/Hompol1/3385/HPOL_006542-RA